MVKIIKMLQKLLRNEKVRNGLQVIAGSGFGTLFVFATITVTAPSVQGGIILTGLVYLFTLVALLSIFRSQSFAKALQHLATASIVSLPIAIVGGIFWAGEPLEILLTPAFFTSIAHIAFLIGIFTGSITDAKTR